MPSLHQALFCCDAGTSALTLTLAVPSSYLRHLACLALSSNQRQASHPGWADSPLAAIFTPGLRFLKSNRVTISGLRETERGRKRVGFFFFFFQKHSSYKYQTGNSLICQWRLPEEGRGRRVVLCSLAALSSFTDRGSEKQREDEGELCH